MDGKRKVDSISIGRVKGLDSLIELDNQ
jgi:hypothetical protein